MLLEGRAPRRRPSRHLQAATLAADAAGILERDYGIDAGEVLSMNVDTVETVTGGIEASSPNFADVVNSWEHYAQRTYSAAFGNVSGQILERSNGTRITSLPAEGEVTSESYELVQYSNSNARTVVSTIPAGKTAEQLKSEYGLSGLIFSDVGGADMSTYTGNNARRNDHYGWWGTALLNPNEYDADNIKASFKVIKPTSLHQGFCFNVTQNEAITYQPSARRGVPIDSSVWSHPVSGYFMNISDHKGVGKVHQLFKAENWRLDNSMSPLGYNNGDDYSGDGWNGVPHNTGNQVVWCSTNKDTNNDFNTIGKTITTSEWGEKITCLARWADDGNDVDYDIECKDGRIQIWGTDNGVKTKVADVHDNQFQKGTYGFWGNNCEQKGQAQISNLNVEISKTYVKAFGDIVYEPSWTDGALHMLINIDTKPDGTMLGSDGGTERSRDRVAPRRRATCRPRRWPRTRRGYSRGTTA